MFGFYNMLLEIDLNKKSSTANPIRKRRALGAVQISDPNTIPVPIGKTDIPIPGPKIIYMVQGSRAHLLNTNTPNILPIPVKPVNVVLRRKRYIKYKDLVIAVYGHTQGLVPKVR